MKIVYGPAEVCLGECFMCIWKEYVLSVVEWNVLKCQLDSYLFCDYLFYEVLKEDLKFLALIMDLFGSPTFVFVSCVGALILGT